MSGETILIVDDHPQNLRLARLLLESEGYSVHTAIDAESALGQISAHRPQLVLMDVQLPGMDGLTLTRLLKADARFADVPILALTANAMKDDEARAFAAGCDGYVAKPMDIDRLLETIARLLHGSAGAGNGETGEPT